MQSFLGVETQLYLWVEFVPYIMIVRQELFASAVPEVSYHVFFSFRCLNDKWNAEKIFIDKLRVLMNFINLYIQFLRQ